MENHNPALIICDPVKGFKLDNHVVLIHDCSDSEPTKKQNPSVNGYSRSCKCFRLMKTICRKRQLSRGSSFQKVMRRMANQCPIMAVIVGADPESAIRFCTEQLAPTAAVVAVQRGKIVHGRPSVYQLEGFRLDSRLNCYLKEKNSKSFTDRKLVEDETSLNDQSFTDGNKGFNFGNFVQNHGNKERSFARHISDISYQLPEYTFGWPLLRTSSLTNQLELISSEAKSISVEQWALSLPNRPNSALFQDNGDSGREKISHSSKGRFDNSTLEEQETSENESVNESSDSNFGLVHKNKGKKSQSLDSFLAMEVPQSKPGWPLHKITTSVIPQAWRESEAREMSVVQWAMSLPDRSTSVTTVTQSDSSSIIEDVPVEREVNYSGDNYDKYHSPEPRQLSAEFELLLTTKSFSCRRFSYEELICATSQFSPENLIGEGGCSSVFKGSLPNGKLVAVKILKPYKEARADFSLEMDIISSLKHKNITSFVGVCIKDNQLISVYDFMPRGSLEEHLHDSKKKSVLPWEVRFKTAIVIAEALNYLHNECSRPVIHRDVKSSNILLSDDFHPQLSDFGLAVWGPTDATYMVEMDVVGTFGYLAPEYFMQGRVSNKIDVFAFGVVLLELLSGRKPIYAKTPKGQESLVKWAKPLMNSRDYKALLDPKLGGNFDIVQMHRMVLAAALCISQSARFRPKVSQILKLLKGEMDAKELIQTHVNHLKGSLSLDEDDELYPRHSLEPHMDLALLDTDNDPKPTSMAKTKRRPSLAEYLKEPDEEFSLTQYLKQRSENYHRAKFGDFLLAKN